MNTSDTLKNDAFTYKINNNYYAFQITLISINGPTETRGQNIKPSAVKTLYIEDTYNNFYQEGYIIIDNSYDAIERDVIAGSSPSDPQYYSGAGVNSGNNKNLGFLFKGESRDILRIDIMPKLDEANADDTGSEDQQRFFRMTYDFAIYNSEEILGDKPDQKFKKLSFWDLTYQLMTEKNVSFTTSDYINYSDPTQLDNGDRAIPTGIAIRELIKATFPENDGYSISIAEDTDTTVTTQPVELAPGTTQADYQNTLWDVGGSNIFFSAPAKFKAIDSLQYLLDRHVSNADSEFDQCFLHLNRYPREFQFTSVKQNFSRAYDKQRDVPGGAYLETMKIGGVTQEDGKPFYDHAYTPAGALYMERIGTIQSFSFDNMPGLHSQQEAVSRFVHSYNYDNKQFNIDALRNSIEEGMRVYKKNYVDCLISCNEFPPYPNFAPGQYRSTNINIDNTFSTSNESADQRLAFGRNRFLYASILMNNLISFRVPGSTHRQAGNFIGIDRDGAMIASKFDDKLLGIYIIVKVSHTFNDGEYFNNLHCIKTYNFNKLENTNADGTISNSI